MMVQQYRNAHGVIFVFDVTDRKSLENIELTWRKVLDRYDKHLAFTLTVSACVFLRMDVVAGYLSVTLSVRAKIGGLC